MPVEDSKQQEVSQNYEAFQKMLPELLESESYRGKFALMRKGEIIEYFDSMRDAAMYGQKEFDDGLFSVQEVTDRVVDLGFHSYALHNRSI